MSSDEFGREGPSNLQSDPKETELMRQLVVNTFLTLDGVMQAPGGPEEDPSGGFTHGGWSVNHWDDTIAAAMDETMGKPFDLLLGRKTYELFAAHWPDAPAEDAAPLNNATKYVASRTLDKDTLAWQPAELLEGDVADAVAKLKASEGPELQVHGSAVLIQTLLQHDLVDRFNLIIYPLVLGTGKRLFGDGAIPANLSLIGGALSPSGALIGRYERAGEVTYGSFAFEEPTDAEVERRAKQSGE